MRARHYTVLIADRSSGAVRRVGVSLRPAAGIALGILALLVLMGLGAKWSARVEIQQLASANSILKAENDSYREATRHLTGWIQSLGVVINDLGERATLEPEQARAIRELPPVVKMRAASGLTGSDRTFADIFSSLASPEDTFGALRVLLDGLENRLNYVRRTVERREALAAATPSIWPVHGWLSGIFGGRSDPFTGDPGFHRGIDISTDEGDPVYATADGVVESAERAGEYGNLIVLTHAFGLATRYGHLSRFNVARGQRVSRGDVIGYVGSTGRSTGSHLHYAILANGKLINPLQLLTKPFNR